MSTQTLEKTETTAPRSTAATAKKTRAKPVKVQLISQEEVKAGLMQ